MEHNTENRPLCNVGALASHIGTIVAASNPVALGVVAAFGIGAAGTVVVYYLVDYVSSEVGL